MDIVIHTNLYLENQVETAGWLKAGFAAHGIDAEVTASKEKEADLHVVQGPWYCLDYWKPRSAEHRVLWLDRTHYGHPRWDISLGWLNPDGSRDFRNDGVTVPHGRLPRLKALKDDRRCAIIFADYGRDMSEAVTEARQRYDSVFFKPHPADRKETPVMTLPGDLDACWALGDVAIGHSSTVLVDAVINGLAVESSDPRHVVHKLNGSREAWLTWLSWANWNMVELTSGAFWEHLREN